MNLYIENKTRTPFCLRLVEDDAIYNTAPDAVVQSWLTYLTTGKGGDLPFYVTPDPGEAEQSGHRPLIGSAWVMTIDEIGSILIMEK